MRIEAIKTRNFRALEDFKVEISGNYTTISGQNNAGKSCLVRIIRDFFEEDSRHFLEEESYSISKDRTQWLDTGDISVELEISVDREHDAELFSFIQRIGEIDVDEPTLRLFTSKRISESGQSTHCSVGEYDLDDVASGEIQKKLKSANNLFVHNSTDPTRKFHFFGNQFKEFLELFISADEADKIEAAQKTFKNKVRTIARAHKDHLSDLLGRLDDAYDVDITLSDSAFGSSFPVSLTLSDRQVEVPLPDWGAGTQNRTQILTAVLQAARIKAGQSGKNTITPVVIVEEPESFLHPTAQAEFGRLLLSLANEFGVQIIATTHSPYMLNQAQPKSNVLLNRRVYRGKLKETQLVDTSAENWMAPFAEHLGIIPPEFKAWKDVILSSSNRVLLVEGEIDVEYFTHVKKTYPNCFKIPDDVLIEPYGGKDSLKHTQLLKFALSRFTQYFITYDLDSEKEIGPILKRAGLCSDTQYCPVGKNEDGAECIEGLLPDHLVTKVTSENVSIVRALSSGDNSKRKSAKSELKQKLLTEFKSTELSVDDLKPFKVLTSKIGKAFKIEE